MKQTVLIYTENYARGGGNRYFTDIANIIPLNYELILASNLNGLFKHDFDRIKRCYVYESLNIRHSYNKNSIKMIILRYATMAINLIIDKAHNMILLKCLLSKYNPKIVISANGGYPAALSCLQLIEIANKKNIYSILTVVSMPQIHQGFIEKFYYPFVLKKVNYLIVNSNAIKKVFVDTRSVSTDKIYVIYNCVDICCNIEKKINDYLTIGYIGRIENEKGIYYLLDAFNKLYKEKCNVKLLLVGDGNIEEIKEMIHEYGIEEYVTLTGFYEGNIEDMLNIIDIFVFPSLWEGFPYSILEAMGAGKIIISTNVGGIPEAIKDGVNGFLVPPADSEQLYNAIKRIVLSFKNYELIGKKAQETIQQIFSPEVFKKKIISIISKG
jgi:glycosyltransferase involved in cell wall biosynthesis